MFHKHFRDVRLVYSSPACFQAVSLYVARKLLSPKSALATTQIVLRDLGTCQTKQVCKSQHHTISTINVLEQNKLNLRARNIVYHNKLSLVKWLFAVPSALFAAYGWTPYIPMPKGRGFAESF